jgi:hypothetical protein
MMTVWTSWQFVMGEKAVAEVPADVRVLETCQVTRELILKHQR